MINSEFEISLDKVIQAFDARVRHKRNPYNMLWIRLRRWRQQTVYRSDCRTVDRRFGHWNNRKSRWAEILSVRTNNQSGKLSFKRDWHLVLESFSVKHSGSKIIATFAITLPLWIYSIRNSTAIPIPKAQKMKDRIKNIV